MLEQHFFGKSVLSSRDQIEREMSLEIHILSRSLVLARPDCSRHLVTKLSLQARTPSLAIGEWLPQRRESRKQERSRRIDIAERSITKSFGALKLCAVLCVSLPRQLQAA